MDADVKFYTESVKLHLKGVSEELIRKLAFDIQAQAQTEALVDTGFLKNSIYTVTRNSSGYAGALSAASGSNARAVMAPEPGLGDAVAAVVAGASYAFWVEVQYKPFLYPALETVARKGGLI